MYQTLVAMQLTVNCNLLLQHYTLLCGLPANITVKFVCLYCAHPYTDTLTDISISEFPTAGGDLTLFFRDSVNLTCSGVTTRKLTQLFWFYDSGAAVCPVRENPFCVPYNITSCQTSEPVLRNCPIDVRGGRRCKPSRVHSYNYNTVENCAYGFLKSTAMMRIDNVTWSDRGVYTCRPTTGNAIRTMNITIG